MRYLLNVAIEKLSVLAKDLEASREGVVPEGWVEVQASNDEEWDFIKTLKKLGIEDTPNTEGSDKMEEDPDDDPQKGEVNYKRSFQRLKQARDHVLPFLANATRQQ